MIYNRFIVPFLPLFRAGATGLFSYGHGSL